MIKRTIGRIEKEIPPSQAAYRNGRSTTEHIFATKILCEKAVTSTNFTIYILMLDRSKAFDCVNRRKLMHYLGNTLEHDELHLISRLLNTELAVRCGPEMSPFFKTDTGVPQGDGYSTTEFTYYLAHSLEPEREHEDHPYGEQLNTQHATEHTYITTTNEVDVDIDMEFADDLTELSTSKELLDLKKRE